jgi:hypothetical protein
VQQLAANALGGLPLEGTISEGWNVPELAKGVARRLTTPIAEGFGMIL